MGLMICWPKTIIKEVGRIWCRLKKKKKKEEQYSLLLVISRNSGKGESNIVLFFLCGGASWFKRRSNKEKKNKEWGPNLVSKRYEKKNTHLVLKVGRHWAAPVCWFARIVSKKRSKKICCDNFWLCAFVLADKKRKNQEKKRLVNCLVLCGPAEFMGNKKKKDIENLIGVLVRWAAVKPNSFLVGYSFFI